MNILLVSDVYLPTVSGVASSTDSIARYMVRAGHTVYLVCPRPMVSYTPVPLNGLHIVYTPAFADPLFVNKSMTVFPLAWPAIAGVLREHQIDIVHIQEPGSIGITALLLAKLYRLPIVGADHFSLLQVERVAPPLIRWASVPFMKGYINIIYRLYDVIMVPTKTAAHELAGLIGRHKRIVPVSNGVDTKVYTPPKTPVAAVRKRYHLDPDGMYFLYLGRLDADKNIDTILRALQKTPAAIGLILAGVGKEAEHLHALAGELGVEKRIVWKNDLDAKQILDLYHVATAFVIMSPVETQSIVALQGLACGLPLLVAGAGALPELVENGRNGYIIDTNDAEALAHKMMYLASHPEVANRMGKASRELSAAHHKPVVLQTLENLYKTLIQR